MTKHALPHGIPMIVMNMMMPTRYHPNPMNIPPNVNQIIFPIVFMPQILLPYFGIAN
jgi:hypothetical protein